MTRGVGAVLGDGGGDAVDVLGGEERAGALHEQHDVDRRAPCSASWASRACRTAASLVAVSPAMAAGRSTTSAPAVAGGRGDGLVVGGDDDVGDQPARPRHSRTARATSGTPPTGARFFAGHALGAAARGDHGEHPAHAGAVGWVLAWCSGVRCGTWGVGSLGRPGRLGGDGGGHSSPSGGSPGRRAGRRAGRRRGRRCGRVRAAPGRAPGRRRGRRAAGCRRGRGGGGRGCRGGSRGR